MDDEREDVLLCTGPEQPRLHRDLVGEVKHVPGCLGDGDGQILRGAVLDRKLPLHIVELDDPLVGLAVDGGVHGAEDFVPTDDVPQGRTQRVRVERAGQPPHHRDVVGRARAFELPEEPQPPLRERQRNAFRTLPGRQRLARPTGPGKPRHQPGDRRRLEQGAQRQFYTGLGTDPADQPDRQQRMTAQGEEVVVHADAVRPEDLGERAAQRVFVRRRGPTARTGGGLRGRQGFAIKLSVGIQRECVQNHERGGHQVLGQMPPGEPAQFARQFARQFTPADAGRHGRNDVRDQALLSGDILPHDHRRLRHGGVLGEHRLHFTRLDPQPTDLHLIVGPACEHELAIRGPPGQVAGTVQAGTVTGEPVRHEPFGRQPRPADVAARQARAADVEFAGHADRNRRQVLVEHEHAGVADR